MDDEDCLCDSIDAIASQFVEFVNMSALLLVSRLQSRCFYAVCTRKTRNIYKQVFTVKQA